MLKINKKQLEKPLKPIENDINNNKNDNQKLKHGGK